MATLSFQTSKKLTTINQNHVHQPIISLAKRLLRFQKLPEEFTRKQIKEKLLKRSKHKDMKTNVTRKFKQKKKTK